MSPQVPDPFVWTTDEAAALLRVSRNTIHTIVRRGELRHIKIGRRVLIPKTALVEFVGADAAPSSPASLAAPRQVVSGGDGGVAEGDGVREVTASPAAPIRATSPDAPGLGGGDGDRSKSVAAPPAA
jgi:excisionase family DNA binding protein